MKKQCGMPFSQIFQLKTFARKSHASFNVGGLFSWSTQQPTIAAAIHVHMYSVNWRVSQHNDGIGTSAVAADNVGRLCAKDSAGTRTEVVSGLRWVS